MSTIPHQGKDSVWVDKSVAERYANAENATAPFAKLLVSKAKWDGEVNAFDLATGTGAAVKAVYEAVPKDKWSSVHVTGTDVSQPMLEYLQHRGEEAGWSGLSTQIVDGNDLTALKQGQYSHVLCTCGIFLFPTALPALHRITQKGGFVGVSTWRSMAWMPITNTCISLMSSSPYNPSAAEVTSNLYSGKAWNEPEYVAQQLKDAGLERVETQVKTVLAKVGSPEMFVESMQFPLKMILASFWPEDKREDYLKELNEIMTKEVGKKTNEKGEVELDFEGIIAWGWKG